MATKKKSTPKKRPVKQAAAAQVPTNKPRVQLLVTVFTGLSVVFALVAAWRY